MKDAEKIEPSVKHKLNSVYERDYVTDRSGRKKPLAGAVSLDEALFIADLIEKEQLVTTLETGVANGLSALAMTLAVSQLGGKHFGIDPCQRSDHDETALVLLEEFGVRENFELMEGPSHLEMPDVIRAGQKFDMIFIDGMHLFDYKLVDEFLADQVLRDGGWLLLHDLLIPSVKKTARFIDRHLDYRMESTSMMGPSFTRRLRYVAGAFLKRRPMWYWWPNSFSNLLVLQKRSSVNHNWDFFRNF